MLNKTLIIRADASAKIGSGHLMRCIALAQFYKSKNMGDIIFITCCSNDALLTFIIDNGFQVVRLEKAYPDPKDLEMMSRILYDNTVSWVVLDGYHLDSAYQLNLKNKGCRLLVIDDMNHLHHYYADLLLNQNIDAENFNYSCEQNSRLLLGTRYILLRHEFLAFKERKKKNYQIARRMMVSLGGADPNNVTLEIIHSLCKLRISGFHVKVIAGPSHPQISSLRKAADMAPFPIEIFHNVRKMANFMAWADLAISAGGTTCWELAYMRVPFAVVILAKNQEKIALGLHDATAAINLGWYSSLTSEALTDCLLNLIENKDKRMELSSNGKNLVDGLGVERVQKQMVIIS
jgi:UDP-2,4-diacetamido-2,4,6-trideoxy-beta-L-altropyranose hydrolase